MGPSRARTTRAARDSVADVREHAGAGVVDELGAHEEAVARLLLGDGVGLDVEAGCRRGDEGLAVVDAPALVDGAPRVVELAVGHLETPATDPREPLPAVVLGHDAEEAMQRRLGGRLVAVDDGDPVEGMVVRGRAARTARLVDAIIELPAQGKVASFFATQGQRSAGG